MTLWPSGFAESYLITSYYGSKQVQQAALQTLLQVLALLEALWHKDTQTQAHYFDLLK